MCGVVGLWKTFKEPERYPREIRAMAAAVEHRGPDSNGFAVGERFAVGHTRLAIVDLEKGNQPLWNEDGTRLVVGNNEVYNAVELRSELEAAGHRFSSRSDTEVILHGWEEWGDDVFRRLNGMFAVALIDLKNDRCVLARDPMGIKPMHYTALGDGIAFGSEIKALLQLTELKRAPDWDAVHLFMNFRYVPDERTLFHGVRRVPPGSYVTLSKKGTSVSRYFDLNAIGMRVPPKRAAIDELRGLLEESVSRHLISDVEVGSYLSGGVDSSLVATLAAKRTERLRTFCMAFGEPTDETGDAARVAAAIGTRHETLSVGASPLERFEDVIWKVEEPKINCLQGFLMAEHVSRRLKVILSGLGGDELFAGYVNNDYLYPMARWGQYFVVPFRDMSAVQSVIPGLGTQHFFRATELGLNLRDPLRYYCILRNTFDHNDFLMRSLYASPRPEWKNLSTETLRPYFDSRNPDVLNALLRLEARTKLPNDFLLTEDRVSMAHSLEVRVPLLDKELVQFAFSLPSGYQYRPGARKRLLKEASRDWLAPEVLRKRKWGFSFDPCALFRTSLRDFAARTLTRRRVEEIGLFNWNWITEVLQSRPSSRLRWHYFNLWMMVGFHIWFDTFFVGEGTSGNRDHLGN